MTAVGGPVQNVRWVGQGRKTAVVEAVGDIDLHRSGAFQEKLGEVLAARPGRIVVDLTAVPYMDSSGVASLVKLLARARRENIDLRLAGLTPRVRNVFEITRLDTVFRIYPDSRQALEP